MFCTKGPFLERFHMKKKKQISAGNWTLSWSFTILSLSFNSSYTEKEWCNYHDIELWRKNGQTHLALSGCGRPAMQVPSEERSQPGWPLASYYHLELEFCSLGKCSNVLWFVLLRPHHGTIVLLLLSLWLSRVLSSNFGWCVRRAPLYAWHQVKWTAIKCSSQELCWRIPLTVLNRGRRGWDAKKRTQPHFCALFFSFMFEHCSHKIIK